MVAILFFSTNFRNVAECRPGSTMESKEGEYWREQMMIGRKRTEMMMMGFSSQNTAAIQRRKRKLFLHQTQIFNRCAPCQQTSHKGVKNIVVGLSRRPKRTTVVIRFSLNNGSSPRRQIFKNYTAL